MTDLTADEKAQVAELLGWSRVLPSRFDDEATWFNTGGDLCWTELPTITLEALLAYCRERGWGAHLWQYEQYCEAEIWIFGGEMPIADVQDAPDPLTALVRAVLAAHEQEKAE